MNRRDHSKPVVLGSTEGGGIHGCERDRCWVVIPHITKPRRYVKWPCVRAKSVHRSSWWTTARRTTPPSLAGLDVIVLRNEDNAGKAESLWRGFQRALAHEAVAIITLDADGQHRPEEIPGLLRQCRTILRRFLSVRGDASIGRYPWAVLGQLHRISGSAGRQACGLRIRSRGFVRIQPACYVR